MANPWRLEYESVTYEKTVKFNAIADAVKTIAVTKEPTKTQYTVGETFDPTGMEVTATYESGKTKVVTDYTVDKTTLGADDKSVVISYQGKKTVLSLTVKAEQEEPENNGEEFDIKQLLGGCFGSSGLGATAGLLVACVALIKKRYKKN